MRMNMLKNLRRRWRLWRICRKLDIKPHPWQREFALGLTDSLEYLSGRQLGKTIAVMLRLLMLRYDASLNLNEILCIVSQDPNFLIDSPERIEWYQQEYDRMARACGIYPFLSFRLLCLHGRFFDVLRSGGVTLK